MPQKRTVVHCSSSEEDLLPGTTAKKPRPEPFRMTRETRAMAAARLGLGSAKVPVYTTLWLEEDACSDYAPSDHARQDMADDVSASGDRPHRGGINFPPGHVESEED